MSFTLTGTVIYSAISYGITTWSESIKPFPPITVRDDLNTLIEFTL